MPGKGLVGHDFNLLEVFTMFFFKTASLILVFLYYFFLCPSICTFPVFLLLLLLSNFGFEQPLLSQADNAIPIEQIATQQTLGLL